MNIIAYLVFTYAFQNAWDNIRQNTRASDGTIFDRSRPEQWWLQSIPKALYSILIKEMIELRRDTRSIITLIQPFAMLIAVMILLPSGGKLAEIEIPLRFWILALFTVLYLTFLPSGISLTALAKEGGNIHLYRSISIKTSFLLWAKFIVICLPMLLLWTSFFVISGIVFEMAIWQIVALSGLAIWLIIGTSLTSFIATGLNVNFAIEEVKKRVSGLVNFMLSSLNIIFASVSFLILCWIIVKLFPETATVTFISSLQILDWLFVENSLIPVLFLEILVIYWFSLSFGWASARNRLTTIE